jgi:hypothetical protein
MKVPPPFDLSYMSLDLKRAQEHVMSGWLVLLVVFVIYASFCWGGRCVRTANSVAVVQSPVTGAYQGFFSSLAGLLARFRLITSPQKQFLSSQAALEGVSAALLLCVFFQAPAHSIQDPVEHHFLALVLLQ